MGTRPLKQALKSFARGDLTQLERENAQLKARIAELESAQQTTHAVTLAIVEAIVDEDEA